MSAGSKIFKVLLTEELNRLITFATIFVGIYSIVEWCKSVGRNIVAGLQIRRSNLYNSKITNRRGVYKGIECKLDVCLWAKTRLVDIKTHNILYLYNSDFLKSTDTWELTTNSQDLK